MNNSVLRIICLYYHHPPLVYLNELISRLSSEKSRIIDELVLILKNANEDGKNNPIDMTDGASEFNHYPIQKETVESKGESLYRNGQQHIELHCEMMEPSLDSNIVRELSVQSKFILGEARRRIAERKSK